MARPAKGALLLTAARAARLVCLFTAARICNAASHMLQAHVAAVHGNGAAVDDVQACACRGDAHECPPCSVTGNYRAYLALCALLAFGAGVAGAPRDVSCVAAVFGRRWCATPVRGAATAWDSVLDVMCHMSSTCTTMLLAWGVLGAVLRLDGVYHPGEPFCRDDDCAVILVTPLVWVLACVAVLTDGGTSRMEVARAEAVVERGTRL